jgi:hypothetical protein
MSRPVRQTDCFDIYREELRLATVKLLTIAGVLTEIIPGRDLSTCPNQKNYRSPYMMNS